MSQASDAARQDELVVFSDYVCPFCYLGKVSLERYLETSEDPPPVAWRPFDLRLRKRRDDGTIDHDIQDGKTEAYYARAKENVQRLAREYGVEMTLDIARDTDAWNAHKLSLHAREHHDQATFQALHDAVFQALWVHGRDIGDPDVLVELGGQAGIQEDEVRRVLADDELDEQLREAFVEAHRAGISGVPTFAYGQLAIPGAIPPEHIGKLVDNG